MGDVRSANVAACNAIAQAARHGLLEDRRRWIIRIDNANPPRELEETHFGGAVALECLMIIEMLVRDVGHDGNIDRDAKDAVLRQRVACHLQHYPLHITPPKLRQTLLQQGCRYGGHVLGLRCDVVIHPIRHRRHQADVVTCLD